MATRIFIFSIGILSSITSCLIAAPEVLTDKDREDFSEKLEAIKNRSDSRVGGIQRNAIKDYRAAIKSDTETMKLYLKCYEKVLYIDQGRKTGDFREWKRRNKERLNSKSLRMALRYQLAWLLLSIEASHKQDDLSDFSARAVKHLGHVFENADTLKDHRSMLSADAVNSVFAKAYKLNLKVKGWPKSALDISGVYERIVMPPMREGAQFDALRAAWKQRITFEGLKIEKWAHRPKSSGVKKDPNDTPEIEKFLTETKPQMLWNMEKDCFNAGNERQASLNMLLHIENKITHPEAPTWIKELQVLIKPLPIDETETPDDTQPSESSEPRRKE